MEIMENLQKYGWMERRAVALDIRNIPLKSGLRQFRNTKVKEQTDGMQIVCCLEQMIIQLYAGLEMKMVQQEKIPGQNLMWIHKRVQQIAMLKVVLQLGLRMEISGPFRKQMLVSHQDGSGEHRKTLQKRWKN